MVDLGTEFLFHLVEYVYMDCRHLQVQFIGPGNSDIEIAFRSPPYTDSLIEVTQRTGPRENDALVPGAGIYGKQGETRFEEYRKKLVEKKQS